MEQSAAELALAHLLSLQNADGSWEGEMVWCTMILSQYVIVRRIVGQPCDDAACQAIIRHYQVTQTPAGAWGLHPESAGNLFTTTLAYVALRLLGLGADDPLLAPARRWLHAQPGGVLANPTWGKFWLALLDLYGYEGINPFLPELDRLPAWLPFHPRRFYCHTRYIYLAISYLYGRRFRADLGPIADELRRELYDLPYESIDFRHHRHAVSATDLHGRPGLLLRLGFDALSLYDRFHPARRRQRALDDAAERVLYEQRTSRYQGLSPVNGLLNCLVLHDRQHPDLAPSLRGLESWKWEDAEQGRRYAGARSQTWDTAFAVQALLAWPGAGRQFAEPLRRAYRFLDAAQLTVEIPDYQREQRDSALGGWCFSDGQHRWPVSDCTAEALSAVLALHAVPGLIEPGERISDERLRQAAGFILSRQNADGGFGTYERRRGGGLLEWINPTEMFGQCMTELSYVECTGSALAALAHYRQAMGDLPGLDRAIERGVRFIRRQQRADGSFAGFWGICFTYGAWHALRGLRAAGVIVGNPALVGAAGWLKSHQRRDGGWGEHYTTSLTGRYVEHPESQVIQTSWALLALQEAGVADESVKRGSDWLKGQRRADGAWPRQAISGVFFGTAMLHYERYRDYFPVWALGPRQSET